MTLPVSPEKLPGLTGVSQALSGHQHGGVGAGPGEEVPVTGAALVLGVSLLTAAVALASSIHIES